MKKRAFLAATALLALPPAAFAQGHSHAADRKGPNGGPLQDVADVETPFEKAD